MANAGPNTRARTGPSRRSPIRTTAPSIRSGRFIVVPDKGFDRVFVYRLDAATGKLLPG